MTKTYCDICGQLLLPQDYARFKVRKEVYSWYERYWVTLEVHDECWRDLCREIEKKRGQKNDKREYRN